MEIQRIDRDSVAIVAITGEMRGDPNEGERLQSTMQEILSGGGGNTVLDLAEVKWINSSGLGQILAAFDTLRRGGGSLKMAAPNPRIAKILETTRFTQVIPTFDTQDEAVTSYA